MSEKYHASRIRLRSLAMAVALTSGSLYGGAVFAEDRASHIQLAAQPLGQALNELARQTGANIVASGSLTEGRQAPALSGELSIEQALNQLLRGTDLLAQPGGDGTFVIVRAPVEEASVPVLKRVIVTGSNIRRSDSEGSNPVQVIDAEALARLGKTSVTEVLRTITANAGNSFNGNRNSGWATGSSGVSLRGLSLKNTLILLNGRRVANYVFPESQLSDAFVDVNALPVNALERIEVLKDGASAIYGSDAVAGVINLITRQDYQGLEVAGSTGFASEGGAEKNDANLFGGFGSLEDDGYNLFFSFKGHQGNRLDQDERGSTKYGDYRDKAGGGLNGWSAAGARYLDASGVSHALLDADGNCPAGMVYGQSAAYDGKAGDTCAWNRASTTTMLPGSERYQLFHSGTFKLGDATEFFYEGNYSHIHGDLIASNSYFTLNSGSSWALDPATGLGVTLPNTLSGSSPNNPTGQDVTLEYTFLDLGVQNRTTSSDFYRVLSGLRGEWRDWSWEGTVFHSANRVEMTSNGGLVNRYALYDAINSGSYNLTNPAANSQAVRDSLSVDLKKDGRSTLSGTDFKISGELFDLPAGPIGFAGGVEWRQESLSLDVPDVVASGALLRPSLQYVADASRDVSAAYAEFNIPVFDSLEIQLAGRGDYYDDVGGAFSPKLGFRWQPLKQVLVRGSVSEGFRAPSLSEASSDNYTIGFTTIVDPLTGATVAPTKFSVGGDDLDPERVRSYNLGVVLSPDELTNISLDYYNIRIDDVIALESDAAIAKRNDPNEVIRDASGNVSSINSSLKNLTRMNTSGFDLEFSRRLPTKGLGDFDLTSTWTYINRYRVQDTADGPLNDYAGTNGLNMSAIPKTKGRTTLGWRYADWDTALTWNYNGSYEQKQLKTGVNGIHSRVEAYNQFDFYLGYEGVKDLTLYLNVDNLLNEKPPYDPWGYSSMGVAVRAPYDVTQYDLLGRYVTLGFNYKFF
ncbi:TonB-dependent receptor [Pseudomonas sp. LRF_L74]|uniref:TonB-dependent receptor n=1 Tax=Pseudomonas sp. LRF_L74 TaxID=3369422 RepID=UPI003F643648